MIRCGAISGLSETLFVPYEASITPIHPFRLSLTVCSGQLDSLITISLRLK